METRPVAVVTGGSSGIGLSIANALSRENIQVFVLARSTPPFALANTAVTYIATDVRDLRSICSAVSLIKKTVGKIKYLVNSAGIGGEMPLEACSEEYYSELFDTNVKGAIFVTKSFLPLLQRGGAVCQISSIAGIRGFSNWSIYSATKFALEGFSASLREELRTQGIRVMVIRPGSVDTPFYKHLPEITKTGFLKPESVARLAVAAILSETNASVDNIEINNSQGDL